MICKNFRAIRSALPFLLSFCSLFLFAQFPRPAYSYDFMEIMEGKAPSIPADLKLKGKVKSYKQIKYQSDSIIRLDETEHFLFGKNGEVLFYTKGDTGKRLNSEAVSYTYDDRNRLRQKNRVLYFYGERSVKVTFYGEDGLLRKLVYTSDKDSIFNYEATYEYETSDTVIDVKVFYHYPVTKSNYERHDSMETYRFEFDGNGNLVHQRDSLYGHSSVTLLTYDSLNRLISKVYKDGCYPSNSCIFMIEAFVYDAFGNLIQAGGEDFTVRNSYWAYSYFYTAKYDGRNFIIEETYSDATGRHSLMRDLQEENPTPVPVKYSTYEVDSKGNWIRMETTSTEGGKNARTERQLTYYR